MPTRNLTLKPATCVVPSFREKKRTKKNARQAVGDDLSGPPKILIES